MPIERGSIRVEGIEVNDPKLDKLALRRKCRHGVPAIQSVSAQDRARERHDGAGARAEANRANRGAAGLALLAKVRLQGREHAYPGELSGGQQQRVAIARSLAMNPEVMLFDEVTAALDPETVKEVLLTIRELADEGMTCILVTHEMRFAREVADHVYFTDRGVIVEHGPPEEFFANAQDARTREFLGQVL